jgi:hypothetical protein
VSIADRTVWLYKAKQAIDDFAAVNIALPKAVTDAIAVMRHVGAAQPDKPAHTAIRQAIIAGADQTELDRLLLADLTHARLASEWTQAHTDTAGAVLAAIRAAEPQLMPALRKQADEHIAALAQIAALDDNRLDALVRAGRQADAALLAAADTTAAALTNLYALRDNYLTPGGPTALTVNGVNAAVWRDPDAAAAHARGKTPADRYIAGLAAGCQLWMPTPAEAIAAATDIAERRAQAAQRRRAAEHGVGSMAAFG